jgi:beta-lactamase superfamily II metal-dependent hydrolase
MQPVHQGMAIRLASETFWEILYPPQAATFAPAMADDRGLVLRLHYGPWRLLFLSDAGFHTEQWLLDSGQDLTADVLIKGHHASDLSGLYPFLDSVAPRLVIWDSDPPHPSELPAWVQRHPDCLTIDQANVGAVHLEIRKHQLSARGFLTPAQSLTLNRAR